MLLKKLRMINFRQYKGEQVIEFSTDPNKNVTVFLGKNTGGKSTFVQAFNWVLYNEATFQNRKAKNRDLLNNDIMHEMRKDDTAQVLVELTLEHKGVEYQVTRAQEFVSKMSGSATCDSESKLTVMYKQPDGQFRRSEIRFQEKINEILPQDLSDYFFFDGERLMTVSDRGNLELAVNTIMGLTPVKNMISHLDPGAAGTVYSEFKKKLVDDGRGEIKILNARREERLSAMESKKSQLKIQKDIRESIQREYEAATRALEEKKQIISLVEDRKKLEREKAQDELWVQNQLDAIREKFSSHYFDIFSTPLMESSLKILESTKMRDKGIPEMNAVAIDYLIKRGYCICGSDLKKDKGAVQHIKEEQENLPPNSIGVSISNFTTNIDVRMSGISSDLREFKSAYETYIRATDQVSDKQRKIEDISDRIGNNPDVSSIENRYQTAKINWGNNLKTIESLTGEIGGLDTQLREVDGRIEAIQKHEGINDATNKCLAYTVELHERMSNIYNLKQKRILETLRSTIKDVFPKMYHGVRTIEVDKNYRVTLTVESRGTLDNSTGLDTVKNFAFIAALLKMAKESMGDEDGVVSEPYPLVMDAPFSNADSDHISNISKMLPLFAQQVIVALMEKDWRLAEKNLSSHVAKVYRLDKQSETCTLIKEA